MSILDYARAIGQAQITVLCGLLAALDSGARRAEVERLRGERDDARDELLRARTRRAHGRRIDRQWRQIASEVRGLLPASTAHLPLAAGVAQLLRALRAAEHERDEVMGIATARGLREARALIWAERWKTLARALRDEAIEARDARSLLGPEAAGRPLAESVARLLGLLEASRGHVAQAERAADSLSRGLAGAMKATREATQEASRWHRCADETARLLAGALHQRDQARDEAERLLALAAARTDELEAETLSHRATRRALLDAQREQSGLRSQWEQTEARRVAAYDQAERLSAELRAIDGDGRQRAALAAWRRG